jgi:hypothetical protein
MSGRRGQLKPHQLATMGQVVLFMRQCGLPWKVIAADLDVSLAQARRYAVAAQRGVVLRCVRPTEDRADI